MRLSKLIQFTALLAGSAISITAHAADQHLLTVTNDLNSKTTEISVVLDDSGNLTGLRVSGTYYSKAQVDRGADIKIPGVDHSGVVVIKSIGVSPSDGGRLRLTYLKNGIWGSHNDYDMYISPIGGDGWHVYPGSRAPASAAHPLKSLYMRKNTSFGKVVGIDSVEGTVALIDANHNVASLGPETHLQDAVVEEDRGAKTVADIDKSPFKDAGDHPIRDTSGKTEI